MPPPRPSSPPPGPGKGEPGTTPETQVPGSEAKLTLTTAKLAAVLKKGLVLRVTGAVVGRHTLVAKYGKTTVAKGPVKVSSGGTGKATLRFTTAGKRKLAKRKRVKLSITGAGARLSVTLKR